MSANFDKMTSTIPRIYNPRYNRVLSALLTALANSDDEIAAQIENAKEQIFIRTATGQNLNKAANSLGVSRPPTLGLSDTQFQELIPNLSLKPKQIRKAFYDTADVFWGPLFSRANVTSNNVAPFNISPGDIFSVIIDNQPQQNIKALTHDIASPGAATATEISNILSRIVGATVSIMTDSLTSLQSINIRTNTPGPVGSIEIVSSSMISPSKLDFTVGKRDILDLSQRVAVYNLQPNELLIEIPAIVPALRRTLKGSHHFHTDGTLSPPVPPGNGIWQGSFFFNPSGSVDTFTVSSQKATLEQTISKGSIITSMTVNSTAGINNPSGFFVLDYGQGNQEGPIVYRGVPNSNTILIDPSYTFKKDHAIGESFNVVTSLSPFTPNKDGHDLPIYFTSPAGSRLIVQNILDSLKAAGIVINFLVLAPRYRYLIVNPYLE